MNDIVVISSGGFDPVHMWHVEHFQEASKLWKLIVWLNSDDWLSRKKWKPFMTWPERKFILSEMKSISEVIAFDDSDDSACDVIRKVVEYYKWSWSKIVFVKWWDRNADNIPEIPVCEELWVEILYNIGKSGKIQSSSRLLKDWNWDK